jgi:hypothetical protein
MAERGGFEPPVRFNPYNGLANRHFRPLSHLSVIDYQRFTKAAQILLNYMLTPPVRFFNPAAASKSNALPLRKSTKIPDLALLVEFGIY